MARGGAEVPVDVVAVARVAAGDDAVRARANACKTWQGSTRPVHMTRTERRVCGT